MTCLPSSSASWRRSAAWSRTSAIVSRRIVRPSGSTIGSAASSCGDAIVPVVRTLCSSPPTRASPPGYSAWMRRSWRDTSLAVAPSEAMRSGSRSTRISRVTPPTRLHAADAFHRRQLAHHREVDEPRQLRVAHVRRRDAERDDGAAGRGDSRDHRLARIRGQVGADAGHRVAHVVDGFADVALEAELDRGRRHAFVDDRMNVLDAGDGRDSVLDLARDFGFELRGRHAGIGDGDDRPPAARRRADPARRAWESSAAPRRSARRTGR